MRLAEREAKSRRKRAAKSQAKGFVPEEGRRDLNVVLGASNARIAKVLRAALDGQGKDILDERSSNGG